MGEEEGISGRGRGRSSREGLRERETGLTAPSPAPSPRQSGSAEEGGRLSWLHLETRGPGKGTGEDNGTVCR